MTFSRVAFQTVFYGSHISMLYNSTSSHDTTLHGNCPIFDLLFWTAAKAFFVEAAPDLSGCPPFWYGSGVRREYLSLTFI
jgi:hypothetical protein